jgi:hypothetical protein
VRCAGIEVLRRELGQRFFLLAGVGVGSRIDFLLAFVGFCGKKEGMKKKLGKNLFFACINITSVILSILQL